MLFILTLTHGNLKLDIHLHSPTYEHIDTTTTPRHHSLFHSLIISHTYFFNTKPMNSLKQSQQWIDQKYYTVMLLIVLNTDYSDLSPLTQLSFSNTTAIPHVYHYLDYDFSIAYTDIFNTESRLT